MKEALKVGRWSVLSIDTLSKKGRRKFAWQCPKCLSRKRGIRRMLTVQVAVVSGIGHLHERLHTRNNR